LIALERIRKLLSMAKDNPLQKRYVKLAKKVSTRTRTRIPSDLKRQICKGCDAILIPGKNATVRMKQGKLRMKCAECGKIRLISLKQTR